MPKLPTEPQHNAPPEHIDMMRSGGFPRVDESHVWPAVPNVCARCVADGRQFEPGTYYIAFVSNLGADPSDEDGLFCTRGGHGRLNPRSE